jgi:hypothetical protein
MSRDGWTVVASLLRTDEAEVLRGLLESAGIEALVEDAALSALNPLLQSAVGGAKVLVADGDAARAAAILSESGIFPGAGEDAEIPEEEWSAGATPDTAVAQGAGGAGDEAAADPGERAAAHAFRTSFVALALAGTLVVPLYAVSAAVRALRAPGPRTQRARRRSRWALAVSTVALALAVAFWTTVVPGLGVEDEPPSAEEPGPARGRPPAP